MNYEVVSWTGRLAKMCVDPPQSDPSDWQEIKYEGVVHPDFGDAVQTPKESSASGADERAKWN